MTLAAFLLARIAEDEATAHRVRQSVVKQVDGETWIGQESRESRVLAECEAKRQIIEDCADLLGDNCCRTHQIEGARILRNLALPYADHPDYREEWRP